MVELFRFGNIFNLEKVIPLSSIFEEIHNSNHAFIFIILQMKITSLSEIFSAIHMLERFTSYWPRLLILSLEFDSRRGEHNPSDK